MNRASTVAMAGPVKRLMNVASETFFDGRTKDVCAMSFPNGLQGSEQRTEQLTMFVLCKSPSSSVFISAGHPNCSIDSS